MIRKSMIVATAALSLGVAACGDYDENEAAYDEGNAAYDAAGNESYDSSGNATYDEGNAAYVPPPDANAAYDNAAVDVPPENLTNSY